MDCVDDIDFGKTVPEDHSSAGALLTPLMQDEELDSFLKKLKDKGVICPIMAMREPFSSNYVELDKSKIGTKVSRDSDEEDLSIINLYLTSLFKTSYTSMSLAELQNIAEDIIISYTEDEIAYIERKTIEQSNSILWYRFRTDYSFCFHECMQN